MEMHACHEKVRNCGVLTSTSTLELDVYTNKKVNGGELDYTARRQ